jgi:hypothetical protein
MSYTRNRNEYNETDNRRVFKILHITSVTGCCLRCAIRKRRNYYGIVTSKQSGKVIHDKIPSWKLLSKNKKQWMEKPKKKIKIGSNSVNEYINYLI